MRIRYTGLTLIAALAAIPAGLSGQEKAPAREQPQVSVTVSARPTGHKAVELPAADDQGVRLSLKDAIAIALANNVDLQVVVASSEAGRYGILQAQGIFDPLLAANGKINDQNQPQASTVIGSQSRTTDFNTSISQLVPIGGTFTLGWNNEKQTTNSEFATVNPGYVSSVFASYTQPLLRNFGISSTTRLIHIAQNTLAADDQSFLVSLQSGITTIEQAYWNLVYARQNLDVKIEAKKLAEELYRITKIKIDVGSQAPIDIVQTEAGVAQSELDIITARQAVGDAEDQLKRQLNFAAFGRWTDHIIPTDEVRVEPVEINVQDGVTQALTNRPEVRSQLFGASSAQINYDFSKKLTLPQLDFVGSYGYAGLGGDILVRDPITGQITQVIPGGYSDALGQISDRTFRSWSIGLNFSIPIFNRAARGAAEEARWSLDASLRGLEQTRQNVTVSVRGAGRAVETARESIAASIKNRELAEENLDAEKKKYDNGLVTSFEVLQIQTALSTARTAELQALTQYRNALASYHQAIGDLLVWKDIKVEGISSFPVPDEPALNKADR